MTDLMHRTVLKSEALDELLGQRDGPRVSIYMPTHRAGKEVRQSPIRLKNLLREAEQELEGMGVDKSDIDRILEPARPLLDETRFWEHQSDGLALFLGGQKPRSFSLPTSFEELAVAAHRFHVKPLLPLVSGDGRFYVLTLSENAVRIFTGTRFTVSELQPEGLPNDIAEALWIDDPEKSLQHHAGSTARGGGRAAAIFHGHGANESSEKTDLLRFFRRIDAGLKPLFAGETAPLVLAGVDSHFPIYREANTYNHLLEEGVPGNPDQLGAEALHEKAWAVLEPRFRADQEKARERYREGEGTGRTSSQVEEIVAAATHGRVESLFVARGREVWGTWQDGEQGGQAVLRDGEPEPGDVDLLDLAASRTLRRGGSVYVVQDDEVPASSPAAAIFRY